MCLLTTEKIIFFIYFDFGHIQLINYKNAYIFICFLGVKFQDEAKTRTVATQTSIALSSNTPRKVKLRKNLKAEKRKSMMSLQKKENDKKLQSDNATDIDLNQLELFLFKILPEDNARFIIMQIRLAKTKPHGRSYTIEFKNYCLHLYFIGPKLYKHMSITFCLPSKSCLSRHVKKVIISPGIYESVFELLKIKIDSLERLDKYCVLCIDEMSLKACLNYNLKIDEIIGIEHINGVKRMKPACSAVVGIWVQPIGYNFTDNGGASALQIKKMVFDCLRYSKKNGLIVKAIVHDMGSCLVEFANSLNVTKDKPYFEFEGEKYFYIFDVPHDMKATRNHLLDAQ